MKESRVETIIKKRALQRGIYAKSVAGKSGSSGVADIELIYNGKIYKVEVKLYNNTLQNNQISYLTQCKEVAYIGIGLKNGEIMISPFIEYILGSNASMMGLEEFFTSIKEER